MSYPSVRARGFTLIEFLMVVAISAILVVGLAAVVEAPRRVAEREAAEGGGTAAADRLLAVLDRDVRFATDVSTPTPRELAIETAGGSILYAWLGPGRPLRRVDASGNVAVLTDVRDVAFRIGTVVVPVRPAADEPVTHTAVQVSSFTNFQLRSGFTLDPLAVLRLLLTLVHVLIGDQSITGSQVAGLVFTPEGLTQQASLSAVRLRLRRSAGGGDLDVKVYATDASGQRPDRSRLLATTRVHSRALPSTYSDVVLPLTPTGKIRAGEPCFVELRSTSAAAAADLETRVLSIASAALATGSGLLRSNDSGRNWSLLGGVLAAGQAVHAIEAIETHVEEGAPRPERTMEIPAVVHVTLTVGSGDGEVVLRSSVPLVNQLLGVTQPVTPLSADEMPGPPRERD